MNTSKKLFPEFNIFQWRDTETFLIRSQYNELLDFVIRQYTEQYNYVLPSDQKKLPMPNFLNENYCLALKPCLNDAALERVTAGKESKKEIAGKENASASATSSSAAASYPCDDRDNDVWFALPKFYFERKTFLQAKEIPGEIDFGFSTQSLTTGAVIWLYFYDRMGIFKILGALLDDYNYKGRYTISGQRNNAYSVLMDMISTLHRLGISSNVRDRISLYEKVLGVTIENNLGIESQRNTGFMDTFNRLIDYQLDYYKSKQLAQAIQAQSGAIQPRSSVATQTSIRDTINVLKQHFEPLQYGRNLINTFLGIATVHATLCLVNMLKAEIGIPAQYNKPEEFIPAAYDILVASKTSRRVSETNRFIVYDNCASYGYRLLTDIETIDINQLTTIASGSTLDVWLNDVEGLVEGYHNAYKALNEKAEAVV